LFGIAISFALAGFWNLKYILVVKRPFFLGLKIQHVISKIIVSIAYLTIMIFQLTGNPMEYSLFAGIILRPALCYLGLIEAAMARERYLKAKRDKKAVNNFVETLEKIK
jgi:hypothetical protein